MKKIFAICIAVATFMSIWTCQAAEDTREKVYFTPSGIIPEEFAENLDGESTVLITVHSREYTTEAELVCEEGKLEKQKKAITEFLNGFDAVVRENGTENNYRYAEPLDTYEHVGGFEIKAGKKKVRYYCTNNHAITYSGGYDVEDADAIMEYMAESIDGVLSALDGVRDFPLSREKRYEMNFETNTLSSEPGHSIEFTDLEKLEFDVTIDESFAGTAFSDVAEIGEAVHCTIENFLMGRTVYILTLEGSLGKRQFYHEEYSWGFSGGAKLRFCTIYEMENGTAYEVTGGNATSAEIYIGGTTNGDAVETAEVRVEFVTGMPLLTPTNTLQSQQIQYETYRTAEEMADGRNLRTLFGLPTKEDVIAETDKEKEEADTQKEETKDPESSEHTVVLRGTLEDGSVWDYKFNFIAEMSLGIDGKGMPEWYENLGKNVTVTLVGITPTENGVETANHTMIRFKGSEGVRWFNNSLSEPVEREGVRSMDTSYNSLVFFDGLQYVSDWLSHDTIQVQLNFSDNEEMDFLSMNFTIGSKKITVESDEMKCVGGGKVVYEKLW